MPRLTAFFFLVAFESVLATNFLASEWNLANYSGAFASRYGNAISIISGGTEFWHVQLTQENLHLEPGKTYAFSFYAQGISSAHKFNVRVGRNRFPYDAFAEFGEITASAGRQITKTFTLPDDDVSEARIEFNLGKSSGLVQISNVSLNCIDCHDLSEFENTLTTDYVLVADTIDLRDRTMLLGKIFGEKFELGADAKIYGDLEVKGDCFLRERSRVEGSLQAKIPCAKQNGIFISNSQPFSENSKPAAKISFTTSGIIPVSVEIGDSQNISPGSYGVFYANAKSKVHFSSGFYSFESLYSEPDAEFSFDLTKGPIFIQILGTVRLGDRNQFTVLNGNPSEIQWNVAGESIKFGTDGRFFGKFVAPKAAVKISSRTHLVGSIYAQKFSIEPQSTLAQEPQASEISHSEQHFGPFFEPGIFRYTSIIPPSTKEIEIYPYANNASFLINGKISRSVELKQSETNVAVTLNRTPISGFPKEAFFSNYLFRFKKNPNYRIFWNPQTKCTEKCNGLTVATALGDFESALKLAKQTGREIHMSGGIWDASDEYAGTVPWPVGFEIVGYQGNIWDLASEANLPTIFLGEKTHLEILGKSPRTLSGFWIGNGFNEKSGGAIYSHSQNLKMKNVLFSAHQSNSEGGSLFAVDSVELENVHFRNNQAAGNGGAVFAIGPLKMQNVIFDKNFSAKNGGALFSQKDAIGKNVIFSQNLSNGEGGAWFADDGKIQLVNATVFSNEGKRGHSAIGGSAKGLIYNSIFWKNIQPSCQTENCQRELSPSMTLYNSIAERDYGGTGNLVENPQFLNESNPGGDNNYLSFSAGLTLQDISPAIGRGLKNELVLDTDILGVTRSGRIDLGAYAWYDMNSEFQIGEFTYGTFKEKKPAFPVFKKLGSERNIMAIGNSPRGRVIRKSIPLQKGKNVSKVLVEFTLTNENGIPYKNLSKIHVPFFKSSETADRCIFQTLIAAPSAPDYSPEKHGRLLVFTSDTSKIGFYKNVQVIPILGTADKLRGKTVEWE